MDAETLFQALRDALFPQMRCLLCGKQAPLQLGICEECATELQLLPNPFFPPPRNVQAALCLYPYKGAARELVHAFKFRGSFDLPIRITAPLLAKAVRKAALPADAVVPVPTNMFRLYARGYHQTYLLSKAVAKQLSLPLRPRALRRKLSAKHQTGLSGPERLDNVRTQYGRGWSLKDIPGKNILLVDDVSTTGATASACAGVLLAMGAENVYLCCIAKVFDES